ncbi:MAG: phosphonate ABC transporter ATP-binding protein [Arhodomonas sp.]|nr:phosphonate ABC transporter ATP-binding protein [Arhodomonas sp.]
MVAGDHVDDEVIEEIRTTIVDNSDALVRAIVNEGGEENQKYEGMRFIRNIDDSDYDYIRKAYQSIGQEDFGRFRGVTPMATESAPLGFRGAAPEAITTQQSAKLSVAGLSKRYKGEPEPVLRNVSFRVEPGERVALLGANGSGKSTLLRCCLRLVEPSAGEVQLFGSDVLRLHRGKLRSLRSRTGFVFQRHNLVGRLSVLTNVIHGRLARARHPGAWFQATAGQECRDEAMHCLEEVGLGEYAARRADRLSGGQSQRVAIARTLMQRPQMVFADEPAASLDPAAGEEVMDLFSRLIRSHGMTLVFSSHDLNHARRHADRVIALRGGEVAFDRPVAAVDFSGLDVLYQREAG